MEQQVFETRIRERLERLYGEDQAETVFERLRSLVWRHRSLRPVPSAPPLWSATDVLLIAYGDSVQRPGAAPLRALKDFLDRRLAGVFSTVHLLPFYPYSSDDGFAVSDFRAVAPDLGTWADIEALGERFGLLFDLVLNHMSREHLWFVNYIHDERPGKDYVIEVEPTADLALVVRPRSTPLLSRVRTPRGMRHVWATFSNDQIDLNYRNPDVLLAMIDILLEYVRHGARAVRLDAVGFLWKEFGTSCIHLPQTHEVVKLLRDLFDYLEPGALLLTETNVPHRENLSYFGDGDEAHMVYQFSLPPLLLHAIHTGDTRYLCAWACGLEAEPPPPSCTFLNFTASHDGVGLRPLEGLLPDEEAERLLAEMRARGGFVSMRATDAGVDRPYELNISYFDAFRDPAESGSDGLIRRFLLSQTLPLALRGIPAVYFNALVATPNDPFGVERTGMTRSINRRTWDGAELEQWIDRPDSEAGRVFPEYVRRLRLRRRFTAFHPEAAQRVLQLGPGLFGVERTSLEGGQRLLALHNCTAVSQVVPADALPPGGWRDALNEPPVEVEGVSVRLAAYQAVWLVNDA
ncbi:MAG: sugar phosphorylase [Gammaproteobacteria bacterium]